MGIMSDMPNPISAADGFKALCAHAGVDEDAIREELEEDGEDFDQVVKIVGGKVANKLHKRACDAIDKQLAELGIE